MNTFNMCYKSNNHKQQVKIVSNSKLTKVLGSNILKLPRHNRKKKLITPKSRNAKIKAFYQQKKHLMKNTYNRSFQ